MGHKNSSNISSAPVPPPFYVLPAVPVPSLKPSNLDFSETSGKPILCAGWIAPHGNRSWSRRNVVYSSEIEVPVPQPCQVRVKIYAAGVNPVDAHRTAVLTSFPEVGTSGKSRCASRHPRPPFKFPYVVGIEGAGVVESVGWAAASSGERDGSAGAPASANARDIRVGDRVAFLADFTQGSGGTFCQYAVVDSDVLWKLPEVVCAPPPSTDGLVPGRLIDFVEAASLPAAAATAYIALFDKLRIETQRAIFISGASGGVGSAAVQLAHYFGLYVIASCSTPNMRYVQSLGADYVVDYTRADVVKEILTYTDNYGVDYLLECAGASMAEAHSETVRFGGALCVLTGLLSPRSDMVFRRQLSVHYVCLGMQHQDPLARTQLQPLGELVMQLYIQGAFSVNAEQVPFVQAADALDVVALGHGRGKIVLTNFHTNEDKEERLRRRHVQLYEKAQRQYQLEETQKAAGAAAAAAASDAASREAG
ncbi:zinc-binding dehydrogenase-like protein [Leishmania donovani]|uniref:Zinc-binding dehydrogenase family protein n=1 Tax=Leishmania donovani TaxID=5661 RepID=A0A3S7WR58_LEIDO|nr:zinc-binding dehydrogenase-like protein [Leishmania donovani]AYU76684.1 zinc-binding dehydrogenase-like protein [Leishmania donovani]TPP46605.1 Zinc-binding dehydrogenase family protein [Leishmania donovani]CBZ32180.1 zinc-binding dehydrogenase-like protein [Leishmania donovani]